MTRKENNLEINIFSVSLSGKKMEELDLVCDSYVTGLVNVKIKNNHLYLFLFWLIILVNLTLKNMRQKGVLPSNIMNVHAMVFKKLNHGGKSKMLPPL